MNSSIENKNCILIIDDDFINREILKNIFSVQYTFEEAADGREGLCQIEKHKDKLCAIILDMQMPEMTGIDILEIISEQGITEQIPTFLITAHDNDELMATAYGLGVMDVISKPVVPILIQKRVKTVIELFHTRAILSETVKGQQKKLSENKKEIDDLHRSTIEALATAIEFRDIESGQHVSRIYGMTKYILQYTAFGAGLSEDEIENMARGAIMHDVGKIAISDVILNKPGRLTREEFEVMKQHTVKGAELLAQVSENQKHDSYRYACDIARHHHERWDGKGYPDGLVGDEISIASQVVSIVDVYDALVSVRVYKKAFEPEQAVEMIKNGECGQFNPKLVECFLEAEPVIRQWYTSDKPDEMLASLTEDSKRIGSVYNGIKAVEQNMTSNSVLDVMMLMTAVQTAYDMIIAVNLTQNTYYMIDYERFQTHCAENGGVFDDLITYGTASVPVSHRKEFYDTFCRTNLLKAFYSGKKSVCLEHPQYGDDGKLHWVETKVLFMVDARNGDVLQITLAQYIDKEYEKREKTRKILSDALSLAEQANNAKVDFLAKMSHDIRTPLNAIIGMTTIIAANLDNKEKINECLLKIGISSKYLLGIINDVLDYSKMENGTLALNASDFNLRDMLTELVNENLHKAQEKQQILNFEVDASVSNSYIGDEFRIRQVLENLLDNACRYTEVGGFYELHVEARRHSKEYDVLKFIVKDRGIGIREEFIGKIFEPFTQDCELAALDSMGLGLSIARNLAHLMNGDIVVSSELGKGSCFTFELPLERGNLTAFSETLDTDLHVLVVDDETAVCEHTSILLQNMGISAQIAESGFEAIALVKKYMGSDEAFDIVIIDWKMPEMDGVETVRQIRQIVDKNVLVVVMSAYDWSSIEEEARAAGVDLFISKPIAETSLRTAIACSEKIIKEHTDIMFGGEKILLAEDNEFNAEIAKTILEMKNLKVDVAPNGKCAYEMFLNSKPGEYLAVFMDIMMPIMDGHEAARAIRASKHEDAAVIPIYAMTANAFRNDILEAKLAGMNEHISKPVDFDEVARKLQLILRKREEIKNGQL